MSMNAKKIPFGGNNKPAPAIDIGSYPGRLVQIIDLGVQPQNFNGEVKPPKQQIMNTYELADEFMKDDEGEDILDKPRWISEEFPLNNLGSELARSTKRYYALDPQEVHEGDWTKLIGTPAVITVVQQPGKGANKDKVYNKISNVSAMRSKEAQKAPALVNEPKVLSLDSTDVDTFQSLPEWIQKKIKESLEWEGTALYAALNGTPKKEQKKQEDEPEEDGIPDFEQPDGPDNDEAW